MNNIIRFPKQAKQHMVNDEDLVRLIDFFLAEARELTGQNLVELSVMWSGEDAEIYATLMPWLPDERA